jgi:chromosomal replication initiator protein
MAQLWETGIRNRRLSMESLATPAPDLPSQPGPPVTIAAIQKLVSERFYLRELRDQDLKRRSRRRVFVLPRQMAMYIVRQLTGASLQEIGREFGGRHHTTVLHSINKIEGMLPSDKGLDCMIRRLIDAMHQQ